MEDMGLGWLPVVDSLLEGTDGAIPMTESIQVITRMRLLWCPRITDSSARLSSARVPVVELGRWICSVPPYICVIPNLARADLVIYRGNSEGAAEAYLDSSHRFLARPDV